MSLMLDTGDQFKNDENVPLINNDQFNNNNNY